MGLENVYIPDKEALKAKLKVFLEAYMTTKFWIWKMVLLLCIYAYPIIKTKL